MIGCNVAARNVHDHRQMRRSTKIRMCQLLNGDKPRTLDCTALFDGLKRPMGAMCLTVLSVQRHRSDRQTTLALAAARKPLFAAQ